MLSHYDSTASAVGQYTSAQPADYNEEINELSSFESLPHEVLWKIFEKSIKDLTTLSRLSLTSKKLKFAVDGFAESLLRLFASIQSYLPRTLTEEEKKLPLLMQLHITQQIIHQEDSKGATALIRATLQAKVNPKALRAMQVLVVLGVNVKQSTANGWTAERYAEFWDIRCASSLLREMADK